jgi:transcriptional regulator GlxA family with amidase domain
LRSGRAARDWSDPVSFQTGVLQCPEGAVVTDLALALVEARLGFAVRTPQPRRLLPASGHEGLREALAHMAQHSAQEGVIETCVRRFAISRRHLGRLFQLRLGISPAQHLMTLRLQEAMRL